MSFTDVGKSLPSYEILTWQICLLTLFTKKKILAKIKFLHKFPNLQFFVQTEWYMYMY